MEFSAIEISRMGRKEEKEEGLGVCGCAALAGHTP